MNQTLDTKMMKLADEKAHVTGLYYGKKFSGTAVSSRQNTCNYREMVTIELDAPIEKPGKYMSQEPIIIWASMVEQGYYSINEAK